MLLLIILSTCTAVSPDTIYSESTNVVTLSCEGFEELCTACQSTLVYEIQDTTSFEIKDLLKSENMQVQQVLVDLMPYISANSIHLAMQLNKYCFKFSRIQSKPSYSELFSEFLNIEYSSYSLPSLQDTSKLLSIQLIANAGVGSDYYVSSMTLDYTEHASSNFGDIITLKAASKRLEISQQKGRVSLKGVASLGNKAEEYEYLVQYPYNEHINEISLQINIDKRVLLVEWNNLAYKSAKCNLISSPKGLEFLRDLPVDYARLVFDVSDTDILLSTAEAFVSIPDFAILPGIKLQNSLCKVTVNKGICDYSISANWDSVKVFNISMTASLLNPYGLTATLSDPPYEMSLQDYQSILSNIYFSDYSIFPTYNPSSELALKLYSIQLEKPTISIAFNPTTNVLLNSSSRISSTSDTVLSFKSRLEDAELKTTGNINTTAVGQLFEKEGIEEEEIFMKYVVIDSDPEGILVSVAFDTDCKESDICDLISPAIDTNELTGYYFPTDFYVTTRLNNLTISALEVYNGLLSVGLNTGEVRILGKFDLSLPENKPLGFDTLITSYKRKTYANSASNSLWKEVLGVKTLNVPWLNPAGKFKTNLFESRNASGLCEFVSVGLQWSGQFIVDLSEQGLVDSFSCRLNSTTSDVVFKYLANMQKADTLVSLLAFPYDILITYNSTYNIASAFSFLSAPATFITSTKYLPNALQLSVSVPYIITAHGNIRASSLQGALNVLTTSSNCELSGSFEVFGINRISTLVFSNSQMMFTITGNVFKGIYTTAVSFQSALLGFSSASWSASFELSDADISILSSNINVILSRWRTSGSLALSNAKALLAANQQLLESSESLLCQNLCDSKAYCITPLTFTCIQKPMYSECIEYSNACNVEITCSQLDTICVDTGCTHTVDVCKMYQDSCQGEFQEFCTRFKVNEVEEDCLRYDLSCVKDVKAVEACENECEFKKSKLERRNSALEQMNKGCEEVLEGFKGFEEIEGSNIFVLGRVYTSFAIEKERIEATDLKIIVEFEYIKSEQMESTQVVVEWDFLSYESNAERIAVAIKEAVVSGNHFTQDLLQYSPDALYAKKTAII